MAAGRVRIGGFSVTTPHNLPEHRRRRKRRVQRLRTDPLLEIDVPKLYARIARLPRVLKRADKMAERLARKALLVGLQDTKQCHPGSLTEGRAIRDPESSGQFLDPGSRPGAGASAGMTSSAALSATHRAAPKRRTAGGHTKKGEGPISSLNRLYFKPLAHWLPPEPLYYSTEDQQERDDFNMLHLKACEVLDGIGLRQLPDKASKLPRLKVFEPPPPPRISLI